MGFGNSKKKETPVETVPTVGDMKTYIQICQKKITLFRNKKIDSIKRKKLDIIDQLQKSNLDLAKSKMDSLMRDEDFIDAYDILGPLIEILLERIIYINSSNECPPDIRAQLDAIIYASSRLEIEEFMKFKDLIRRKYGQAYITKAENNADNLIDPVLIQKLQVKLPSEEFLLIRLKQLCREKKIKFDFPNEICDVPGIGDSNGGPGGNPYGGGGNDNNGPPHNYGNQYGPPDNNNPYPDFNNQYGPPPGFNNQYGPPSDNNNQYGPPPDNNNQFGPPLDNKSFNQSNNNSNNAFNQSQFNKNNFPDFNNLSQSKNDNNPNSSKNNEINASLGGGLNNNNSVPNSQIMDNKGSINCSNINVIIPKSDENPKNDDNNNDNNQYDRKKTTNPFDLIREYSHDENPKKKESNNINETNFFRTGTHLNPKGNESQIQASIKESIENNKSIKDNIEYNPKEDI